MLLEPGSYTPHAVTIELPDERKQADAGEGADTLEHIDLMRDEFMRIRSCPGADAEIKGLCDRAITRTEQNVPVLRQRDEAVQECDALKANFPPFYCPECKIDTNTADEDGCCVSCGCDLTAPASGREVEAFIVAGLNRALPADAGEGASGGEGMTMAQACEERDETRRWLVEIASANDVDIPDVRPGESVHASWRRVVDAILADTRPPAEGVTSQ
ncbi:MAG: hypothetical protein GY851_21785 [bacterium]|nr:hypothetical protein [bacterium]